MSEPTVHTQVEHIDHWCRQWRRPTREQEQDWRDIERHDFMSHDERLRPVERRKQEELLFMIRDDLRREREQDRAMVASLRRSAVNGVYRMAAATGGDDSANSQQQIGCHIQLAARSNELLLSVDSAAGLDTEPMCVDSGIFSEPQPTGSSTLAPSDHGDTILYYIIL